VTLEKLINKERDVIKNALWNKNTSYLLFLIISIFLINSPFLMLRTFTTIDEFTSLAIGAFFGGHDWSDLIAARGTFHGYGFVALFTPFFRILNNGEIIYRILLAASLGLRIATATIIYRICVKHFLVGRGAATAVALLCELGTLSATDSAARLSVMNEIPLSFIVVLSTFLCLEILSDCKERRKNICTVILGFVLAYGYIIHSRILIFWIALGITYVIIRILFKDKKIRMWILATSFIATLMSLYFLNNFLKEMLWRGAEASVVHNTMESIFANMLMDFQAMLSLQSIYNFFFILASLIGTFTIYSFGLIWIVLGACVAYIYKTAKEKQMSSKVYFMIILGNVSFWGMNVALAIVNVPNVLEGDLRAYTYFRYSKPFMAILLIAGIVILLREVYFTKLFLTVSSLGLLCSLIFLNFRTVERLMLHNAGIHGTSALSRLYFRLFHSTQMYFLIMSVLCILLYLTMLVFIYSRKSYLFIGIYLAISLSAITQEYSFWIGRDGAMVSISIGFESMNEKTNILNRYSVYYSIHEPIDNDATYWLPWLRWNLYDVKMQFVDDASVIDLSDSVFLSINYEDYNIVNANYVVHICHNRFLFTSNSDIVDELAYYYDVQEVANWSFLQELY